jgi:hypothetical protein
MLLNISPSRTQTTGPQEAEAEHVDVGGDQGNQPGILAQDREALGVDRRGPEDPGQDSESYDHAQRTQQEQRLAAELVDEGDRHQGRDDVGHAGDHRYHQRVLLGEADDPPQRGGE